MLLVGTVGSALLFGYLLSDFRQMRLIQVVQGAGAATMVLNLIALWKQEARNPSRVRAAESRPDFRAAWRSFVAQPNVLRFLVATALGTLAFGMQDILLEPYGGQILGLGVGATTVLTALMAGGTLAAFALAARSLARGADPYRLAGMGGLVGLAAFASVILAAPFDSPFLFRVGAALIGFGAGLFSVGTLTVAMGLDTGGLDAGGQRGLALGVWGAVQATAAGCAIALGGLIRDGASALAARELLGPALTGPATGYGVVYHLELLLLFATLIAIGPLVRVRSAGRQLPQARFGLAEFPG
jgi:BCD family chlorophyll transporter-like MFS transporter